MKAGERLDDVGEPHRDLVYPASDVADEAADEAAGHDRDRDRGDRDPDVDARREQHPAQEIHAVAVRTQRMGRGRRREECGEVDLFRSPRRENRREHRAENHDREEERAARDKVAADLRPGAAAVPGRLTGSFPASGKRRHVYTRIRGSSAAWTMSATRKATT